MAFDQRLADRVREYLHAIKGLQLSEKKVFGGLAFMVKDKMCVNVSKDRLMCRFDPELTEQLSEKTGFLPMIMKGKELKGYCYVAPDGYKSRKDFEFWISLCLDFNDEAKSSKRDRPKKK
ncbi:TfoX/Sxy family protein [Chitinophaga sp. XS-30]|uniref:TfoX/Sxy family protein n=1 Tax=Chitinophaga sp. XS-30 TaxID=2604421 RepID=UPI0011DE1284|nr:TfoX/Sxy family protein [Chitinophaga sp. XS-30]QEH43796.1 TfoX/Sxy family protein [Chitinophaga sp. XS-30]